MALVAITLGGILQGLIQGTPGLEPERIDCEYRAELIRERTLSFFDRSSQAPPRDPATEHQFRTLLRETREACATKNPELLDRLSRFELLFEEHQARRTTEATAREELLAPKESLP